MAVPCTIYEWRTGRISHTGNAATAMLAALQTHGDPELAALVGVTGNAASQYVDLTTYELAERPRLDTEAAYHIDRTEGEELAIALPADTEIIFEGTLYPAQSELIFTTQKPGRFVVTLIPPFPYQPMEVTIHAD